MKDFRTLKVWERSHIFAKSIYKVTEAFPHQEVFGLTSQIRRASISIPTNLAKGCGRGSTADFARFVQIAIGSASEVEYLILLSFELKYIDTTSSEELLNEINELKRMLIGLYKKLKLVIT